MTMKFTACAVAVWIFTQLIFADTYWSIFYGDTSARLTTIKIFTGIFRTNILFKIFTDTFEFIPLFNANLICQAFGATTLPIAIRKLSAKVANAFFLAIYINTSGQV